MLAHTDLRVSNYAAATAMARHTHDAPSINVVVGGGFHESIGGDSRDYRPGHVAFCPAGVAHAQEFGPKGARQIIFRPRADWLGYLEDSSLKLGSAPYVGAELFRFLGARLLGELDSGDAFSSLACEGLMLEIVAAFGRGGTRDEARSKPPLWLARTHDFVRENALENIDLAAVARAAGRHEIHVAREFRRFYGIAVGGFVRKLRTEAAANALLDRKVGISEIALACGFASHAHLCREFKTRYGVTPSQFRARNA